MTARRNRLSNYSIADLEDMAKTDPKRYSEIDPEGAAYDKGKRVYYAKHPVPRSHEEEMEAIDAGLREARKVMR